MTGWHDPVSSQHFRAQHSPNLAGCYEGLMVGISGSVVNHVATSIGTAVYGAPKGRGI